MSDSESVPPGRSADLYRDREATPPVVPTRSSRPRVAPPLARRTGSLARHRARRSSRLFWELVGVAAVGTVIFIAYRAHKMPRAQPARPAPSLPASLSTPAREAPESASTAEITRFSVARLRELPDRARDTRLAADTLAARGLAAEALERLERELAAAPTNLELKSALADHLMDQRRFDDARRLLSEIIEAQPRDPEPRRRLAAALLGAERFADAYDMVRWYLDAAPADLAGRKLAARICLDGGWYDQALVHLRSIADSRQEDVETRQLFALAYLRLGQYVKAVSQLAELARGESPDKSTFYNLALAFARQEQAGETIRTLTRAVELFGASQVLQWMSDEDFRPLQNDPLFRTFRAQLSQQNVPEVVSLAPRRGGPGERDIGMMPGPMMRGVPELKR